MTLGADPGDEHALPSDGGRDEATAPDPGPVAATAPTSGAPVDAPTPPIRLSLGPAPGPILLSDLLATAGRKAMWVHLDRMLAREPGVRDPERPDELRKYRVAIRRLRAALRMFAAAFPDREVRPLRRGLSELAATVGAIRDLDNRVGDIGRWATERGGDAPAGVAVLTDTWARDRERAVTGLYARLDSRRHRRLLTALIAFVDLAPPTMRRAHGPRAYTVHDRVASLLWTAYEDARAFAPVIRWADLETIHELRISGKRLRDDLDFLADLLPPDDRAWLAERLVALQDHLGALNDATVTVAAVRAFLEHWGASPGEQAQIAAYLTDKEREVALLRRTIWRPWRPVVGIGFARKLSRVALVRPPVA
jgi:CHAD domain-containing protein